MNIIVREAPQNPDVVLVNLEGRLDANPSEEVEASLMKLIKQNKKKIILNLDRIDYLGSSGIKVFLSIKRELSAQGGDLRLLKMSSTGKKILKAMEIDSLFEIFDDEKKAIKSFDQ